MFFDERGRNAFGDRFVRAGAEGNDCVHPAIIGEHAAPALKAAPAQPYTTRMARTPFQGFCSPLKLALTTTEC
jgi:hypothetical protein